MIATIRGKILQKNPPQVVVECGGLGYEIDVPMSTFYNLPNIGEEVFLETVMIVREDAQLLMMRELGYRFVRLQKDISHNDRFVIAQK